MRLFELVCLDPKESFVASNLDVYAILIAKSLSKFIDFQKLINQITAKRKEGLCERQFYALLYNSTDEGSLLNSLNNNAALLANAPLAYLH